MASTSGLQNLNNDHRSERFLFLLIVFITALTLIGILGLSYFVASIGINNLPLYAQWLLTAVLIITGGSVLLVLGALATVIMAGRDLPVPYVKKLRSIAVKYFLPVFIAVGKILGISKEEVQHAFVAVNNQLVMSYCKDGHPPERILLLMPHCLQNSECPVKITYRVQNCKRCGKCVIKDLLELSEKYNSNLSVATGGTIARRIVIETKPDLIIAVACERDLTSGIQDTAPLPVYGIFNRRPHGPCFNTQVDLEAIEEVLKEFRTK